MSKNTIPDTRRFRAARLAWFGGALALAAVTGWCGAPRVGAAWLPGDEHAMFIRGGLAAGQDAATPLPLRIGAAFTGRVAGGWQPLAHASYLVQWPFAAPAPPAPIRIVDLAIHAINGVLVAGLLTLSLRRFGRLEPGPAGTLGLAFGLLWALHPALAPAWAADLGRGPVLGTFFAGIALLLYARSAETRPATNGVTRGAAPLALALACLALPLYGLVLAIPALVWGLHGVAALRSRTTWIAAAVAGSTLLAALLAGGPAAGAGEWARLPGLALQGVLHLLGPVRLAPVLPAPTSGLVLAGAGLLAASLLTFGLTRGAAPGLTLALAAFWGPLLGLLLFEPDPVRTLYLPAAAILLLVALGVAQLTRTAAIPTYIAGALVVTLALGLAPQTQAYVQDLRSPLGRAARIVAAAPESPLAFELAAALAEYAHLHPPPQATPGAIEAARERAGHYLVEAATLAQQQPERFVRPADRAALYRRLSLAAQRLGDADLAVTLALPARELEPDALATLTRFAHALRAAGRMDEASGAYVRLETHPEIDTPTRALRQTEYADLLLEYYDMPEEALPRYRAAVASGYAPPRARPGLARCEILAGSGQAGFELASELAREDPGAVEPALLIGLYHIRSHHFDEALQAYVLVLRRDPTNYEALRGFHELCGLFGRWEDAPLIWQRAREAAPERPELRSWLIWAAACAGQPEAPAWTAGLLEDRPDDRFGHLARMLLAARAGDWPGAVAAIAAAGTGRGWPEARELARAEKSVGLLIDQGGLPPAAQVLRAGLLVEMSAFEEAEAALAAVRGSDFESLTGWQAAREAVSTRLSARKPG